MTRQGMESLRNIVSSNWNRTGKTGTGFVGCCLDRDRNGLCFICSGVKMIWNILFSFCLSSSAYMGRKRCQGITKQPRSRRMFCICPLLMFFLTSVTTLVIKFAVPPTSPAVKSERKFT